MSNMPDSSLHHWESANRKSGRYASALFSSLDTG